MWPAPERDIWRPRTGILSPSDLRRALREHPAWQLAGQRLVRELRFKDFPEAFSFVERLATEAADFGRHPDICILDGNRVRVSVTSPRHAGITIGDLRLLSQVDAVVARYASFVGDAHEHSLAA